MGEYESFDPYEILGLPRTATKKEIRARYKELALANHPDKLSGLCLSSDELAAKEEYFKKVNVAYNVIIEHHGCQKDADNIPGAEYWKDLWDKVSQQNVWGAFVDVATKYIKRKIHKVVLPVTLEEVWNKHQKRVQFFLKGITEPVKVTVDCGRFPYTEFEYEADDDSYHNIRVTMVYKEHDVYHIDEKNRIHTFVSMNLSEYITGKDVTMRFLDGKDITIVIPPFHDLDADILMDNYDLTVQVGLTGICEQKWATLHRRDQSDFCQILEKIV
jgi:hypothetical protein